MPGQPAERLLRRDGKQNHKQDQTKLTDAKSAGPDHVILGLEVVPPFDPPLNSDGLTTVNTRLTWFKADGPASTQAHAGHRELLEKWKWQQLELRKRREAQQPPRLIDVSEPGSAEENGIALTDNSLPGLWASISRAELVIDEPGIANDGAAAVITGCRLVASYNWIDDDEPTILVPGKPPLWTPLDEPTRLPLDPGRYVRDKCSAQYPMHPLEPAVTAALAMMGDGVDDLVIDDANSRKARAARADGPTAAATPAPDLVCCASSFGNLLRFVRGWDKGKERFGVLPFRMILDFVGGRPAAVVGEAAGGEYARCGTVFMTRREDAARRLQPQRRTGYGHSFPAAYTAWEEDVLGSADHLRVVEYALGGLRIWVRFECDGYLDDAGRPGRLKRLAAVIGPRAEVPLPAGRDVMVSDTAARLARAAAGALREGRPVGQAVVPGFVRRGYLEPPDVRVRLAADQTPVPQEACFDIKTRSVLKRAREDTLAIQTQRLWARQLDRLVLAYHDRGTFVDVRIISGLLHANGDRPSPIAAWEHGADNAATPTITITATAAAANRGERNGETPPAAAPTTPADGTVPRDLAAFAALLRRVVGLLTLGRCPANKLELRWAGEGPQEEDDPSGADKPGDADDDDAPAPLEVRLPREGAELDALSTRMQARWIRCFGLDRDEGREPGGTHRLKVDEQEDLIDLFTEL